MFSGLLMSIVGPIITIVVPVILLIIVCLTMKRVENIEDIVNEIKDDSMHVIPHRLSLIEDILRDYKADMEKGRNTTNLHEKKY